MSNNWDIKIRKMETIKNMIFCLKPNLTDHIMIVKMFLISQLVYIASVIKPTQEQILEIETLILNFIYIGQRIFSKDKSFSTKKSVGLGIPNLKQFFDSIRTKFASRAAVSVQSWAMKL